MSTNQGNSIPAGNNGGLSGRPDIASFLKDIIDDNGPPIEAELVDEENSGVSSDADLDGLIAKINTRSVHGESTAPPAVSISKETGLPSEEDDEFVPIEPASFREAGLTDSEVESIVLKFFLSRGDRTGREVAEQVRLPFILISELLGKMKIDRLVAHRDSSTMGDYLFELTDAGRERARRLTEHCTYFGAAPVSLKDYINSVNEQSLEKQRPTPDDLRRAFSDLLINEKMFKRLGPAVNSGRGLFLYGAPGNGKTSIAERITIAFGKTIWIPRAITVDGEIIRIFDPNNHTEAPLPENQAILDQRKVDRRWVRINRPTITAGGELTMDNLEVAQNPATGTSEAPLQLKSNCGTLLIDDFGRQRMSVDELLNRWIVPLEKRYDFLNLSCGTKFQVPFDQLIIFSTNLEPRDLCDEAFLRRIPYKIEIIDPTEEEFRLLFQMMCDNIGFEHKPDVLDYLIKTHYHSCNRNFRSCQPRDLLIQVRNYCYYHDKPLELLPDYFDFAVDTYFSTM